MPLRKIHHPVGAYTAEENGAAPLPAAGSSRRAVFVISLICAAQFVLQLDFSVVNVALPSIQRELGMPAALAIWQATTAAGATAGIVAGGLLTQYFGWRALFLINPPIIAIMLALVPRLPAGKRSGGGGSVDVRGALLVTTGIAALIFGLSSGQQHGFTAPATIIALALAVLLTTGFVFAEKRSAAPMLPLSILAEPARRAAIAAMLLIGAILAGYVYFASLYLQKVLGFSPVATGLALVPSTVTVVLVSTLGTRRLLARFSIKAVLLAGLACMGAGQLWLAQITAGASYPAAVLPGLVLTAAGVGLALPTASIAITSGVQASDQGLAGALFTTSQQTGAAVGLAILATAAAAATDGHGGSLVDGYRLSFLIATGLAVLAAIIVALQLSSKSHRVEPGNQQAGPGGPPPAPPAPAQLGKSGPQPASDHGSSAAAADSTCTSSPAHPPPTASRPRPVNPSEKKNRDETAQHLLASPRAASGTMGPRRAAFGEGRHPGRRSWPG